MDETLAANFCPFRSQTWPPPKRSESVAFSITLWRKMLSVVSPSVIVCLGAEPRRYVPETLAWLGAHLVGEVTVAPVSWEPQTYTVADYHSERGTTRVVGIPHLSRFRIFGRKESRTATDAIVAAMLMRRGAATNRPDQ